MTALGMLFSAKWIVRSDARLGGSTQPSRIDASERHWLPERQAAAQHLGKAGIAAERRQGGEAALSTAICLMVFGGWMRGDICRCFAGRGRHSQMGLLAGGAICFMMGRRERSRIERRRDQQSGGKKP